MTKSGIAWGWQWTDLKADRVKLQDAPKGLFTARLNNAAVKLWRQMNDYHAQATGALFEQAEEWINWERVTDYPNCDQWWADHLPITRSAISAIGDLIRDMDVQTNL